MRLFATVLILLTVQHLSQAHWFFADASIFDSRFVFMLCLHQRHDWRVWNLHLLCYMTCNTLHSYLPVGTCKRIECQVKCGIICQTSDYTCRCNLHWDHVGCMRMAAERLKWAFHNRLQAEKPIRAQSGARRALIGCLAALLSWWWESGPACVVCIQAQRCPETNDIGRSGCRISTPDTKTHSSVQVCIYTVNMQILFSLTTDSGVYSKWLRLWGLCLSTDVTDWRSIWPAHAFWRCTATMRNPIARIYEIFIYHTRAHV